MARLPKPGSDQGKWGEILNDYLSQAHTDTGTLKDNTVGTNQLQNNSITTPQLQDNAITTPKLADNSITTTKLQDGAVTENALASEVKAKLNDTIIGTTNPTPDTIVQRTSSGSIKAGEATADDEVVTRGQMGRLLAKAPPVRTSGTKSPSSIERVQLIDDQGAILRSSSTQLQRSTDGGNTWTIIGTLPRSVSGVRQLDNGEILVGVTEQPGSAKATMWISSGYPSSSTVFSQRLEVSDYGMSIELSWGYGGGDVSYAVSEYDSKPPGSRSSTQVAWITRNSGDTWAQIYDHGTGSLSSRHIHGVSVDPYRPGTIWLTLGDYTGSADTGDRRIRVSRDYGLTWADVTTMHQPTAIMCFPNVVAFGSDNSPNGVLVVNNPDADPTLMRLSIGYQLDREQIVTRVAEKPFRALTREGYITLLPFSTAKAGTSGVILGSYDGALWFEVWRDGVLSSSAGQGLFAAFGPTSDGRILIRGRDVDGASYEVQAPLSPVPSMVTLAGNLATAVQRNALQRAYIQFNNQSAPYQTMVAYNEQTILLHPSPQQVSDLGGLFTRVADGSGVVVNRDAFVRVEASAGKPISFSGRYDTIIRFNAITLRLVSDMVTTYSGFASAGTKISVVAQPNAYNGQISGFQALAIEGWETGA